VLVLLLLCDSVRDGMVLEGFRGVVSRVQGVALLCAGLGVVGDCGCCSILGRVGTKWVALLVSWWSVFLCVWFPVVVSSLL
jgi:hypothetical protein